VHVVLSHSEVEATDFLLPFLGFPSFLLQQRPALASRDVGVDRPILLSFIGNCDPTNYSSSHGSLIPVLRAVAVELLLKKFGHLVLEIRTWNDKSRLNERHDRPLLIVDSFLAGLDSAEYTDTLRKSEFFLVLPGISSVLTHSLYECLYCGCVPVLPNSQEFDCHWVHSVNCLKYSCSDSLLLVIEAALRMPLSEIAELRRNAMKEFERVFRLDGIAERIVASDCAAIAVRNR